MMKRITALAITVCILAVSVTAAGLRAQIGRDMSGFTSETVDGNAIDGSVFSEHGISVVMFWATWSFPSLRQLALMQQVHEARPDFGVYGALLTDATSTPAAALEYMSSHGITFPSFVCEEQWLSAADGSSFIPQTFIVNSEGIIVEAWQAEFTSAAAIIERLAAWAPMQPDGDITLNGVVTTEDALVAMRIAMDMMSCTPAMLAHGDVNPDGVIDASDALLIFRISMGMV